MKIKGTSLKSTLRYVEKNHPEDVIRWKDSLPIEANKLYVSPIMATDWYPMMEGMIIPVRKIADLFYNSDEEKAAYEVGKYSAQDNLNGIYKIFVKVASPIFVLKKSQSIFSTYYTDTKFEIIESTKNSAEFRITGFVEEHAQIFSRISGWIFETLKVIGSKPLEVTHSYEKTETDFVIGHITTSWE